MKLYARRGRVCEEVSYRAFFTSFQPDWVPAGKILSTALQHWAAQCCREEQGFLGRQVVAG